MARWYDVFAATFCVLIALIALYGLHKADDINRCRMTFMYQLPQYIPIGLPEKLSNTFPDYGLYVYGEGEGRFEGVPVLFLPGNAGSYKQVRSIASVFHRKNLLSDKPDPAEFNVFSVDFSEQLSGLYGGFLELQTEFAKQCVFEILKLYENAKGTKPRSVVLVGHSMGGWVARNLFTHEDFDATLVNIIITLATPHVEPVANADEYQIEAFKRVNSHWLQNQRALRHLVVASIGGGGRDRIVRSELTPLDHLKTKTSSEHPMLISALSSSMPRVFASTDHLCIAWCNEVILLLSRILIDSFDPTTRQITSDKKGIHDATVYHIIGNYHAPPLKTTNISAIYRASLSTEAPKQITGYKNRKRLSLFDVKTELRLSKSTDGAKFSESDQNSLQALLHIDIPSEGIDSMELLVIFHNHTSERLNASLFTCGGSTSSTCPENPDAAKHYEGSLMTPSIHLLKLSVAKERLQGTTMALPIYSNQLDIDNNIWWQYQFVENESQRRKMHKPIHIDVSLLWRPQSIMINGRKSMLSSVSIAGFNLAMQALTISVRPVECKANSYSEDVAFVYMSDLQNYTQHVGRIIRQPFNDSDIIRLKLIPVASPTMEFSDGKMVLDLYSFEMCNFQLKVSLDLAESLDQIVTRALPVIPYLMVYLLFVHTVAARFYQERFCDALSAVLFVGSSFFIVKYPFSASFTYHIVLSMFIAGVYQLVLLAIFSVLTVCATFIRMVRGYRFHSISSRGICSLVQRIDVLILCFLPLGVFCCAIPLILLCVCYILTVISQIGERVQPFSVIGCITASFTIGLCVPSLLAWIKLLSISKFLSMDPLRTTAVLAAITLCTVKYGVRLLTNEIFWNILLCVISLVSMIMNVDNSFDSLVFCLITMLVHQPYLKS